MTLVFILCLFLFGGDEKRMWVHMCVSVYVCMLVYIYVEVWVCMCMLAHVHVKVSVCTCVLMHACVLMHLHRSVGKR